MIDITRLYCGREGDTDSLRYGHGKTVVQSPPRPVVVWNVTPACNLRCVHCYAHQQGGSGGEILTTDEGYQLLDNLAAFGVPVVLFSGGEPLKREDIFDLIGYARQRGLRTVLSTNGTLITRHVAGELARVGLHYAGVSLDGIGATNDRFRHFEGAYELALEGIRNCRRAGVKVGLRFTLTRHNVGDIEAIFKLLVDEDIPRVCFYHLVYTGRGRDIMADDLTHDQARASMDVIIDHTVRLHQAGLDKQVLTVDNHADGAYLLERMRRENHPRLAEARQLLERNRGNRSGSGIGCVSWDGTVYPDQFWRDKPLGNVREKPFSAIWGEANDDLLGQLRRRKELLKGRCATCGYLDICNGNFRARAEAATGDIWASDPACYLTDEEIASR
ncbi:MAG: radical SAM protein [Sedimentisphaerales bacterium]|nr:radical SAM protein [Sedimentisphaerales bacterium]